MIKDLDTIRRIARNWGQEVGQHIRDCPAEARVVTGRMIADGQYYYFERDSGIRLCIGISDDGWETIQGYDVLDEQRFMWFKLRWLS